MKPRLCSGSLGSAFLGPVLGLALAAGLCLPAFGQAGGRKSGPNQSAVTYLNTLNQGQISLGNLMTTKAQSQQVRQLAQNTVSDHQNAESNLRDLASKNNLQLYTDPQLESSTAKLRGRLQAANGEEADQEYVRELAQTTKEATRRLKTLEGQVTDPALRHYIAKLEPKLSQHEHKAATLEQMLQPTGQPAGQASSSSQP